MENSKHSITENIAWKIPVEINKNRLSSSARSITAAMDALCDAT